VPVGVKYQDMSLLYEAVLFCFKYVRIAF